MESPHQQELEQILDQYPLGPLEKDELVGVIRRLLDLCEQTSGKNNKKEVAIYLYRYIDYNYWFLIKYQGFNQTVANKAIEQSRDFGSHHDDFQRVKLVANFLVKFRKLKPFQIEQSEAEEAYQSMLQREDSATISALFNLSLERSYLSFAFKLIEYPQLDINCQNNKGDTPLIQAARNGHNLQLIEQLIDLQADPKITNKKGKTARDLAAYQNVKDYLDSSK